MLRSYFKTAEVAEMFQTNEQRVRRWIRQGALGAVDICDGHRKVYRVPEAEVVRFAEERATERAAS